MYTKHTFIVPALIGTIAFSSAGSVLAADNGRGNATGSVKEVRNELRHDLALNGAMGIVTAINGTTLTIASAEPGNATTTLTVNAASTTVKKLGLPTSTSTKPQITSQSLSNIAVGERVIVRGTRTASTIVAAEILEIPSDMPKLVGREDGDKDHPMNGDRDMKLGRGVVGVVQDKNGTTTTFTLKAMNDTLYTVNAASTTVRNGTATSSVTHIKNGDRIAVHGDFASTTITAKVIMENIPDVPTAGKKEHATTGSDRFTEHKQGFFERIRGVFGKIFGHETDKRGGE